MRQKILLGALFASLITIGYGSTVRQPAALADDSGLKNVKVLTGMSKADLKKFMKSVASSLGVQCDHCHDTDDMSKDTPKKEKAREMLKMVATINKDYFKGEQRVTCMTCHNGKTEPKK
jgi:hypothetical protein